MGLSACVSDTGTYVHRMKEGSQVLQFSMLFLHSEMSCGGASGVEM